MNDRRWEATIDAATRIERAAESNHFDHLRGEMESIVARFHDCRDDAPARVVLALARACLAVLDADEDDEDEDDDDFE